MRLTVDLLRGRFVTSRGVSSSPRTIEHKRGDTAAIEIEFCEGSEAVTLPEGASLVYGVKERGKYDAGLLLSVTDFTLENGVYKGTAGFDQTAIDAALNVDEDEENDLVSLEAMAEVSWTTDDGTLSSDTKNALIVNDVNRSDDAGVLPTLGAIKPLSSAATLRDLETFSITPDTGYIEIDGTQVEFVEDAGDASGSSYIENGNNLAVADFLAELAAYVNGESPVDAANTTFAGRPSAFDELSASLNADNSEMTVTVDTKGSAGNAKTVSVSGTGVGTAFAWNGVTFSGGRDARNPVVDDFVGTFQRAPGEELTETQKGTAREEIGLSFYDTGAETGALSELGRVMLSGGLRYFMAMDAGSGNEVEYFSRATVTAVGDPGNGASSSAWGSARNFVDTANDRFELPGVDLTDGFAAVFGIDIDTAGITRGVVGQSDFTGATVDWYVKRDGGNQLSFVITRQGGSGNSTVESSVVMTTGTEYHVSVWYSPTSQEVGISVNGVIDRARAVFGIVDTTPLPVTVGAVRISGSTNVNYHKGDIGYFALFTGEPSGLIQRLDKFDSADWENFKNEAGVLRVIGDSLTEDTFVSDGERWSDLVADEGDWVRVENHGYGGYTSGAILAQVRKMRLDAFKGQAVTIWVGNNDGITTPAAREGVAENLANILGIVKEAGASRAAVGTCPNRLGFNSDQSTIDDRTDDLDALNILIRREAAEASTAEFPVKVAEIKDAFTSANYTAVDGDDTADMAKGLIPRSARDTPSSSGSTHFGASGNSHMEPWWSAALS